MKSIKIILTAAALLAAGCQQARMAKTDHQSVYHSISSAIPLDGSPTNIMQDGGRLYVTSFHDSRLWVIDASSGRELQRFENFDHRVVSVEERDEEGNVTGQRTEQRRRACAGEIALAEGKLFVEQVFCDSLLVFDANTLHPIDRIKTGSGVKMVASPNGKELYVASTSKGSFSIIDVNTYEKKDVAYPEGGRGISALSISPEGDRLYLGIQRGAGDAGADATSEAAGPVNPLDQAHTPFLAIYDLAEQQYIALKSIGDTMKVAGEDSSLPAAFAFSADGQTLYIAMSQCMAGVHVFDTATNELREPITFASLHERVPFPGCRDIAVRGDKIYVTVGSNNELVELDSQTHERLRVFPLGGYGTTLSGRLALSENKVFVCHQNVRRLLVAETFSHEK